MDEKRGEALTGVRGFSSFAVFVLIEVIPRQ